MKQSKIAKSRAALIIDQPFFASILLPMPLIETKDIPTFATDGETILYNPDWAESLSQAEVTFVLAHEVLHCVFDHMGRRETRDPDRWNRAADYVINQLLVDEKVGSMPKVGLLDKALVTKGNGTAEGVYNVLGQQPQQNQSSSGKPGKGSKGQPGSSPNQPGQPGSSLDSVYDSGTENGKQKTDAATIAQKSAELKVRVIQARNAAKMQGRLSAGLERILDEALKPVVDWKNELRRFMMEKIKTDYSYSRPKRRFLGEDFILPSLSGESMGRISIGVDCSGSVDDKLLAEFAAEINAIKEDLKPSVIEVIYFEDKVSRVETFERDEEFKINANGGGGTAFSPVFKHINKQSELPVVVVMLTDLECDDFGPTPDYPVLWAFKGYQKNPKAPFGEIIKVEAKK